jgi:hypothetical protein
MLAFSRMLAWLDAQMNAAAFSPIATPQFDSARPNKCFDGIE